MLPQQKATRAEHNTLCFLTQAISKILPVFMEGQKPQSLLFPEIVKSVHLLMDCELNI